MDLGNGLIAQEGIKKVTHGDRGAERLLGLGIFKKVGQGTLRPILVLCFLTSLDIGDRRIW